MNDAAENQNAETVVEPVVVDTSESDAIKASIVKLAEQAEKPASTTDTAVKPEVMPEVKPVEPDPVIAKATDEDKAGLDRHDEKTRQEIIRDRIARREAREEQTRLNTPPEPPKPEAVPVKRIETKDVAFTFDMLTKARKYLADVQSGEEATGFSNVAHAQQMISAAKRVIADKVDAGMLAETIRQAQTGAFGAASEAIERLAREELPVKDVLSRRDVETQETQKREYIHQLGQTGMAVDAAIKSAGWAELADANSPEAKFVQNEFSHMTPEEAAIVMRNPAVMVPKLLKRFRAVYDGQRLRTENEAFRSQMAKKDQTAGPSRGAASGAAGGAAASESDMIKAQILALAGS